MNIDPRARLVASLVAYFGFTREEAEQEVLYIFLNPVRIRTQQSYLTVRRIGATKLLNRATKSEIWKIAQGMVQ